MCGSCASTRYSTSHAHSKLSIALEEQQKAPSLLGAMPRRIISNLLEQEVYTKFS